MSNFEKTQLSRDYLKWQCLVCGYVGSYMTATWLGESFSSEPDYISTHFRTNHPGYFGEPSGLENFLRRVGNKDVWKCIICKYTGKAAFESDADKIYEHFKAEHKEVLIIHSLKHLGGVNESRD